MHDVGHTIFDKLKLCILIVRFISLPTAYIICICIIVCLRVCVSKIVVPLLVFLLGTTVMVISNIRTDTVSLFTGRFCWIASNNNIDKKKGYLFILFINIFHIFTCVIDMILNCQICLEDDSEWYIGRNNHGLV